MSEQPMTPTQADELVALLRREGRYSGVWFAERLLEAASLIEQLATSRTEPNMTDTHALERTSPKGPGQKFIGRCFKCGAENLSSPYDKPECANPANISQDEALLMAIKGPVQHD